MRAKFINNRLYEMAFSDIKIEDVINKDTINVWLSDNYKNELFMYTYANEHGLNPEEMDTDEWIETDEAKEWIKDKIENRFHETIDKFRYEIIDGYEIPIWRKMSVPANWLGHLQKEGSRLGIYWSWDPEAAEEHWGYIRNMKTATIESSIGVNQINWIDTIRLNMDPVSEDEKEIRLFKNTLLKIKSLEIDGKEINITPIKNKIFKA